MTGAAFFDVDGTLLRSNIVRHYHYLATYQADLGWKSLVTARLLSLVPYYLLLDRCNRDEFNRLFYLNYWGMAVSDCQTRAQSYFQQVLQPALFPAACAEINWHRQQGRQIVLVTGSLDFIIAPLADWMGADTVLAAQLQVATDDPGIYTGELTGVPIADQEKARLMQRWAIEQGIDLSDSYAYGDSIADLPMLTTVGQAIAVNPDRHLYQYAQRRNWRIERWTNTENFSKTAGIAQLELPKTMPDV